MLIDLHVHTSRYSPCGRATAEEMVAAAIKAGLDGLAITEHHVQWSSEEIADLQAKYPGIKILRGIEITTLEGEDLLVYGVHDPSDYHLRMPAREAVDIAHERGGFVSLAHPYRYRPKVDPGVEELRVDGVEIASSNILSYAHPLAVSLARRKGALPIACSDAHAPDALGLYAMYFPGPVADEDELVQVLQSRTPLPRVGVERVSERNAALEKRMGEIRDLIGRGYDNAAIRKQVPGVGYTVFDGVRQGLDVFNPEALEDERALVSVVDLNGRA